MNKIKINKIEIKQINALYSNILNKYCCDPLTEKRARNIYMNRLDLRNKS